MDLEKKEYVYRVKAQGGFLGAIKYEDVVSWLRNFQYGTPLGYYLLDNLIVLTRDQIKSCIRTQLDGLKSIIYQNNLSLSDGELEEHYKRYIEKCAFICTARNNDHASSANMIGRMLRGELGEKLYHEYTFSEMCKGIEEGKIKAIYLVDDFLGTGRQMTDFIEGKRGAGQVGYCSQSGQNGTCTIKCIYDRYCEIPMNILVIASHIEGINKIKKNYPRICIKSTYMLDDTYNLFSNHCKIYTENGYKEEEINYITSEIKRICEDLGITNQFGLGMPICIEDRFPNNSLELYWWNKTQEWKPLLEIR